VLLLVFPVAMGAGLAMQTAVNAKMRQIVLSPYLSSGLSFLIAWLFLLLLSIATHQPLLISPTVISHNPGWLWLGGLFGTIALTGNVILFQAIGSLQTTVLPIMGQIFMSIIIDQFGLFNSPVAPLTIAKLVGLLLIVGGVVLSLGILDYHEPFSSEAGTVNHQLKNRFYQTFAVISGMLMAMQTAINGHLGTVLQSPVQAAFISFTIGVVCLLLVNLITLTNVGTLRLAVKQGPHYWWIWIGGIIGALYILGSAWLVPRVGTGQVVVLALFGQLLGSALIENYGLFESAANRMTRSKSIGLLLMFIGVLAVKFITL